MKHPQVALAVLALVTTFAATDYAALNRTGTPYVAFHGTMTIGGQLNGTTNELDLVDQGAKVTIRVPLRNLTTGIQLRDHHMRDKYLQIGSYPNAELTVDRSALHMPTGDGQASGDAAGSMAIHGKSNNVTFHYRVTRGGGSLQVQGSTHLNIRDYGIDIPSYLGVTVKPDIDIDVQFTATE